MVIEVMDRPVPFKHIATTSRWYELVDDKGVFGYMALKEELPAVGLHLEILRWSHNVLKTMIEDWQWVLHVVRQMGATNIYATNPNYKDRRWAKLLKHFGFPEPKVMALTVMEV